jgi:hypothetical protein
LALLPPISAGLLILGKKHPGAQTRATPPTRYRLCPTFALLDFLGSRLDRLAAFARGELPQTLRQTQMHAYLFGTTFALPRPIRNNRARLLEVSGGNT